MWPNDTAAEVRYVLKHGAIEYDRGAITELIKRLGCSCATHDDAALCARCRQGDVAWRTDADALGAAPLCDCDCHQLWLAYVVADEERYDL